MNSGVNFRRTACWLTLVGWALSSPVAAAADDLIERFATIETVWASRIAPDGKHVALGCSTHQGLRAACVYQLDARGKKPLVYTSQPDQRIENLFWAGPDWLLLHLNRNDNVKASSDNISLLRLDRLLANNVRTGQSSVLLEKDVPQVDLTDVAATPAGWSGEIVMRATSDYGLGAYRVDLSTGRGKVLERYSPLTMHMLFDEAGAPVLELKYDRKQQRYVLMSRKDGVEHAIGEEEADEVSPLDWAGYIDGGNKLAGLGYADDGTVQPYVYDIATRTRSQADASLQNINVSGWISERTSDAVVGVYYTTDYPRQKFFDETLERARLAVAKALPEQTIYLTSWSAASPRCAGRARGARHRADPRVPADAPLPDRLVPGAPRQAAARAAGRGHPDRLARRASATGPLEPGGPGPLQARPALERYGSVRAVTSVSTLRSGPVRAPPGRRPPA